MSNEQKQAIEYGVPLRETCEQMEWKDETFFFWCFDYSNSIWEVCYFDMQNGCYKGVEDNKSILYEGMKTYKPEYVLPAPQMDKIAKAFCNIHIIDNCVCTDYRVLFDHVLEQNYVDVRGVIIENNHFAQAYAELYLKLKKQGLLK